MTIFIPHSIAILIYQINAFTLTWLLSVIIMLIASKLNLYDLKIYWDSKLIDRFKDIRKYDYGNMIQIIWLTLSILAMIISLLPTIYDRTIGTDIVAVETFILKFQPKSKTKF